MNRWVASFGGVALVVALAGCSSPAVETPEPQLPPSLAGGGASGLDPRPEQHIHVAIMDNYGGTVASDADIVEMLNDSVDFWKTSLPGWLGEVTVEKPTHYTSELLAADEAAGDDCHVGTMAQGDPGAVIDETGWVRNEDLAGEAASVYPDVEFTKSAGHLLILMPPSVCTDGSGHAQLTKAELVPAGGTPGVSDFISWQFTDTTDAASMDANTRRITHEMGHNYGLEHIESGYCTDPAPECRNRGGGLVTNIMGRNGYGLLTTAQRSLFDLVGDDEVVDLALPDGEETITQQFTISPLGSTSDPHSVRVTDPDTDIEYWLDYQPEQPGIVQSGDEKWMNAPQGLLVQHFVRANYGQHLMNEIVAENADEGTELLHLFQPGETYVNFDGNVSVTVDSMDATELVVSVTLKRS